MILHFVTDEKFTDYAIEQFSSKESHSKFVLIPCNFSKGESYVKNIDKVSVVYQESTEFSLLLKEINQYSAIVFHGLFWTKWQEPILKAVNSNVKVAWVFWGGEIYDRHDIRIKLAPITSFLNVLYCLKNLKRKHVSLELPLELFKRVDFCLTGEFEEFVYAKEVLENSSMKHLWYTYYSIEETVGNLITEHVNGNNVWVGNSATLENNHYDTLLRLKITPLGSRKIITPLSYGKLWVKNSVIKIGRLLFGDKFQPLVEYMPRDDYNKLMLDCSTMIMPHYRPQAQGNILTGLWLGMRVYLSEKSIAFNFFKRIGVIIFSFESDFKKYGYKPMLKESVETNKKILRKWYGKEHVMKSVEDLIKVLDN